VEEREHERPAGPFREGLAAGALLAVADLLATGPARVPWRIAVLTLALGVLLGTGAGFKASLFRWLGARGRVVAAGAALYGLSVVSKTLAGGGQLAAAVLVVALALATGLRTARATGRCPALAFVLLSSLPGASLLAGALPATALAVVLAFGLPFAVALLLERLGGAVAERTRIALALGAGLLVALPSSLSGGPAPRAPLADATTQAPPRAPDLVLVVVDTLREDALPPGGLLERLGEEGVRFDACLSAAPWTLPSVASLLTSLLPSQHGAVSATRPLPEDVTTLAELLRAHGYATAAFTGGAFVGPAFRLDQGFEHFDADAEQGFRPFRKHVPLVWRIVRNRYAPLRALVRWVDESPGVRGVGAGARAWLRERDRSRPAFLFVHTYEVHDYYLYHPDPDDDLVAPGPLSARFAGRLSVHPGELADAAQSDLDVFRAIYDGRVAAVERELELLLAELDREPARPRVLVVVSDHGEGFDAARGRVHHGGRLHDDLLRVPLVLHAPGLLPAGRVAGEVRTVDLMPTLLELAGAPLPDGLAGRSLVAAARGATDVDGEAWSEERTNGLDAVVLRRRPWKLVRDGGVERAYDLAADPHEERPDAAAPAQLLERLRSFSERYPPRAVDEATLDADTRAHLRDLGYVE
jgi:arylsulfatase A-like enzyme